MKLFPPLLCTACLLLSLPTLADHAHGGWPQGQRDWEAEYRDGPCRVKEEFEDDGYEVEIKCRHGHGAHWRGEWKEEFRVGACRVKREAKFDEYKEEVECDDD